MKPATLIGIVLIVIGLLALAYRGINYTTQEEIARLGPLEAKVERQKTIPLPPLVGGLALAGGVVLVVLGSRRA